MKAFLDTSAVLSLALHDGCYVDARRVFAMAACRLASGGVRNMKLRGERSAEEAAETLYWLEHTFALHHIRLQNVNDSRQMAAESRRMVQHFSPGLPHGTIDVIHVASARLLRAEGFFTFDSNQSALAKAAGFQIVAP